MMDADLWMVSSTQEPDLRGPRGDLRKATERSPSSFEESSDPEDLVPNWVLDKGSITQLGTIHPTLNDLYQRGISPQEFRLIRQGNSQILKRMDGRVWATAAVPRLIAGGMVLTNGVKRYKLSHTSRAPWETSHEALDEDLTIFTNQQNYEINKNLLDDFSLSYSFYKT